MLLTLLPYIWEGAQSMGAWAFPPNVNIETVVENVGQFVVDPSTAGRVVVVGSLFALGVGVVVCISVLLPL